MSATTLIFLFVRGFLFSLTDIFIITDGEEFVKGFFRFFLKKSFSRRPAFRLLEEGFTHCPLDDFIISYLWKFVKGFSKILFENSGVSVSLDCSHRPLTIIV